ncbi:Regulation of nuclear pre-mRNA domain containing protein 1B [Chytriomyces hyalinus]|nr:Regulation of nuclear pre-mRNA domain containing protein 1B [Chytriomyces hyalinus]
MFNEETLVGKLGKLTDSQDSINLLSHWLIHHRSSATECVQVWASEFDKVSTSKRLAFLYLANDVLQVSRKKSDDYAKAFAKALPESLARFSSRASDDLNAKVRRILTIWEERAVYPRDFVEKLKSRVKGGGRPSSPSKPSPTSGKPPAIPTAPSQHSETVKNVLNQTESIKSLHANRSYLERAINSAPATQDASVTNTQFNSLTMAFTNELQARQKLILDLKKWIRTEEGACAKIVDAIQDLSKGGGSTSSTLNPTPSPTSPNNSSSADFESATPIMSPNSPSSFTAPTSMPPPPPAAAKMDAMSVNSNPMEQSKKIEIPQSMPDFVIPAELLTAAQNAIQNGASNSDEVMSLLTELNASGSFFGSSM